MSYVFQDLSNGEVPTEDLGELGKFYDIQKVIGT